ncbi:MAG TPA: hypothetical protein VMQ93_11155 [Novosphingobium sp.]|nr:hypothetical protein [Novosphingobium sp.]
MELRGALVGLRQNDIEWERGQRALARALAAWRAEPVVGPVLRAMQRFGDGAPLDRCAALAQLFDGPAARGHAFADSLVAAGIAALDGHPLGQLPLLHGSRDAAPMLVLAQSGGATLALAGYDGTVLAALPRPLTARFRPVETWKRVLAGTGQADHVLRGDRQGGVPLEVRRATLVAGEVFHCFGPRETREVRQVDGAMVVLSLERELDGAGPVRELAREDGALVHQASARPQDSRDELAMALLGRMKRIDAVPQMARLALGGGGDAMRWQALREVIALDVLAGVELLAQIAADPEDSLAAQAAALLPALLRSRPELRGAATWPG